MTTDTFKTNIMTTYVAIVYNKIKILAITKQKYKNHNI